MTQLTPTTPDSSHDAAVPAPAGHPPRTSLRTVLASVDRPFLALDATVRLPTAMFPLGILLYVASLTGSYGLGGLAVAALSIGGGVGGPLVGIASDRFGQRPVALAATALQVLALGTVLALHGTEPLTVTVALVAVVGLANPQAGAMARSRWSVLARRAPGGRPGAGPGPGAGHDHRGFVSSAMAFEGAVDETMFVVGPVLVSTLAALGSPTLGLVVALVLAAVTQTGFGLHPSALPGRVRTDGSVAEHRAPLPTAYVVALLVATGSVGLVFGATSTGVAARMALAGTDELTGPVYALMGIGSAVTGLLTTRLPRGFVLELRIAVAGLLLVLAGLLAASVSAPVPLALANLLLGVALAPALVTSYALADRVAPPGRGTTMMTALATANVVGVAAGSAVAGRLVDGPGPGAALLVDAVAGALVLGAGLAALALGRRSTTHG
ncbi:Predicted arabinose efflux permease, MFS family [Nocardioides scoriae]|uniref:Predicted arabinose efflux permease, MFS family n=1 Tax=Nocardioides scoriae TaxID=642780 RepID=A0A1H1X9J8_9ACTN|nr:hypothetical protein [Nocardioides scoriae]SDT05750.1 Predicted arabinose efflux permease, MFS family [Nocardioides scoriae]